MQIWESLWTRHRIYTHTPTHKMHVGISCKTTEKLRLKVFKVARGKKDTLFSKTNNKTIKWLLSSNNGKHKSVE